MFKKRGNDSTSQHDKELRTLIENEWGDFEHVLHRDVGRLMSRYLKWQRRSLWAVFFLFPGPVLFLAVGQFVSVGVSGQSSLATLISVVLINISLGIFAWIIFNWSKASAEFNKVFNPIVFEKAFQMLGFTGVHATKESVTEAEIISLLDHSELITENRNRYEVDDMISTEYHGRPLFMAELRVRYVTGSGKNRSEKLLFHGFFAVHDLPRHLEGKTFITTERDRRGFGGVSLWQQLFNKQASPRETLLEWNDFENKLHVATTNEVEARYILTPDFMGELYDWWKERGGNIRVSFLDNRLYVLLPDRNVRIGISTIGFKEKHLKFYMLTVMRPVWHLQQLMKHAEARLRKL